MFRARTAPENLTLSCCRAAFTCAYWKNIEKRLERGGEREPVNGFRLWWEFTGFRGRYVNINPKLDIEKAGIMA